MVSEAQRYADSISKDMQDVIDFTTPAPPEPAPVKK